MSCHRAARIRRVGSYGWLVVNGKGGCKRDMVLRKGKRSTGALDVILFNVIIIRSGINGFFACFSIAYCIQSLGRAFKEGLM